MPILKYDHFQVTHDLRIQFFEKFIKQYAKLAQYSLNVCNVEYNYDEGT